MPTISTLTVDVQSRTSKFSKGLAVAIGGLAALATGAAYAFGKFEESENVLQQTDAVIKSTGKSANVTAQHVDALADAISRKSGVDDEQVQAGLNMLLTFKNIRNEVGQGNKIFDQAAVSITDVAAGMAAASQGTLNMKQSSIQVGKALNDPIAGLSALTRVGIQFTEQQVKQITKLQESGNLMGAQKIILAELTSQFAGSAEAQATASGKMSVAFENLAEVIGAKLAPVITAILDGLTKFAGFLQDEVGPALKSVWEAVQPVAEVVGAVLAPAFEIAWHAVRDKLLPALEDLMPIFKLIGLAVVAFVTVIGVQIAIAITVISTLIDIVGEIVKAFMKVVDWVREHLVGPISDAIGNIIDAIGRLIDWVRDRLVGAWNAAFNAMKAPIQAIIDFVGTLIGAIQSAIEWLGKLLENAPGGTIGVPGRGGFNPNLPGAATGGFVARTGAAIIHQGETIVPAGMSGGVTVIINGDVSGDEIVRKVRDGLLRLQARNATTGL